MPSSPPKPENASAEITLLLGQLGAENGEAEARLMPLIYDDLRRMARNQLRFERPNHTLQPTALVHEAYLRLLDGQPATWQNRAHFFAAASRLMRHILVDHARSKQADKRGGAQFQVTLTDGVLAADALSFKILALHEALERLARFDARQGRIVELHFFGGLGFEEIAFLLALSERTVKRDWSMARAWLKQQLAEKP